MLGDIKLGRIEFEWPLDDVPEALGGALEVIGKRVAAGEPGARGQTLKLPIRADSLEHAERLRRQVRSLLNNEKAMGQGVYFRFELDPELNGWLIVGGGDITDEKGGMSVGEWQLDLRDVYRLGSQRTLLDARRLEAYDRRESTTPRDFLKRVYADGGSGFEDRAGAPAWWLPYNYDAPTRANHAAVTGGTYGQFEGLDHGDVLSFLQAEDDMGVGDVLILDQRGNLAPAGLGTATDADPQANYDWEEVYGPDYPLTIDGALDKTDVPALQNGECRCRWVDGSGYGATAGKRGLLIERNTGTQAAPVFTPQAHVELMIDGAAVAAALPDVTRVVEWTPERAVLALWWAERTAVLYVTLQRGWRGPRLEFYGDGKALRLRSRIASGVAANLGRRAFPAGTWAEVAVAAGTGYGDLSTYYPAAYVRATGTTTGFVFSVLREAVTLTGRMSLPGVDIDDNDYLSVWYGVGPLADAATAQALAVEMSEWGLYDSRQVPTLVGT